MLKEKLCYSYYKFLEKNITLKNIQYFPKVQLKLFSVRAHLF